MLTNKTRDHVINVHLPTRKLKCICNVYVKLTLKSRLKSIPFGLNKVDPACVPVFKSPTKTLIAVTYLR